MLTTVRRLALLPVAFLVHQAASADVTYVDRCLSGKVDRPACKSMIENFWRYNEHLENAARAKGFPSAAAAFKAQQANRPDQLTPQLSGSDDAAADAPAGGASASAAPALVAPPSPTDASVEAAPSDGASRPPAAAARNGNQPDSTLSSADRL